MGEAKTAYRIDWRPKASEDLRAIVACIGRDNPRRAKSFGEELRVKPSRLHGTRSLAATAGRSCRTTGANGWYIEATIIFYRVLFETRMWRFCA